jgi:hypothetical protein
MFLLLACCVHAQFLKPSDVPIPAKNALASIYPDAALPAWKRSNFNERRHKNYTATFVNDNGRTWVTLDQSGKLKAIEKNIDKNSIPDSALAFIHAQHPNTNVVITRKIMVAGKNLLFVSLKGNHLSYSLLFDENGKFIKEKSNLFVYIFSIASLYCLMDDFLPYNIQQELTNPPAIDDFHAEAN